MCGSDSGLRRGLEADFDEVQWVANEDPDSTRDIPGPEVGGHRVIYLKLSVSIDLLADGTPFILGPHMIPRLHVRFLRSCSALEGLVGGVGFAASQ